MGWHVCDYPARTTLDPQQNLYVACYQSNNVLEVAPDGTVTQLMDGTGDGAANPLRGPYGVAYRDGRLYVTGVGTNNAFPINLAKQVPLPAGWSSDCSSWPPPQRSCEGAPGRRVEPSPAQPRGAAPPCRDRLMQPPHEARRSPMDRLFVPWYRRSDVNTAFAIVGLLVPPLLWFVCFNLITGKVYYTRRSQPGRIETWSGGNRVTAYLVLGVQVLAIVYGIGSIAWVSTASRPAAEAVVSRYFEALKDRRMPHPPRELYASKFWSVVTPSQYDELIVTIRRDLGVPRSYERVGIGVDTDGSVRLIYDVEYDRGRHTKETFDLGELTPGEGIRIMRHEIQPRN